MNRTAARAVALATFAILAVAACGGSNISGMGGGPACTTCAEVYINGGIACGPSGPVDAWETLAHCACGAGPCANACVASFCIGMPADMNCGMCLGASCSSQLADCSNN